MRINSEKLLKNFVQSVDPQRSETDLINKRLAEYRQQPQNTIEPTYIVQELEKEDA
jgi:hypothetical protein